jgi:hypothetical protein
VRGDLAGQPLLGLRAPGEELHGAGELRQPEDPRARQVAHVRDTDEGQQVVLAHRAHRDVADDDELVVARVVGEGRHLELRHGEHLEVRPDEPPGGVDHRLGLDRQAECGHQLGGGRLGAADVDQGGVCGDPAAVGPGRKVCRPRLSGGRRADGLGHLDLAFSRRLGLTLGARDSKVNKAIR